MKVAYEVADWKYCPKCMTRTVKCKHRMEGEKNGNSNSNNRRTSGVFRGTIRKVED